MLKTSAVEDTRSTMKTTLRWIVVPVLSLLAGCSQGAETSAMTVEGDPIAGPSWEDYLRQATVSEDGSTYYVAEWDLFFETEAALRKHYEAEVIAPQPKLAVFQQISTGYENTFAGNDALDIVYCVSNTFANQSTVISDVAAATQDWQLTANVHFTYDLSQDASCSQNNGNVDFAVVPTTVNSLFGCGTNKMLWAAAGGCPVAGGVTNAVGVLAINYNKFPASGANSGLTPTGVMRHELGHILGFRHEHPWAPAQGNCSEPPTDPSSDATGRRLTDYDQLSVMHYPSCNGVAGADHTISYLDGVGARSIYGIPASWYVPIFDLTLN